MNPKPNPSVNEAYLRQDREFVILARGLPEEGIVQRIEHLGSAIDFVRVDYSVFRFGRLRRGGVMGGRCNRGVFVQQCAVT